MPPKNQLLQITPFENYFPTKNHLQLDDTDATTIQKIIAENLECSKPSDFNHSPSIMEVRDHQNLVSQDRIDTPKNQSRLDVINDVNQPKNSASCLEILDIARDDSLKGKLFVDLPFDNEA